MGRLLLVASISVAGLALAAAPACHLAETPDAISCPAGSHADTGKCVQDDTAQTVITIGLNDAGACIVTPDIIGVASTGSFQFKNDDNVDHTIMGVDGQSWATVPAHQSSAFISITKPGHWAYDVSGCSQGGSVSVE
jgi:hypothetical protein